MRCTGVSVFPRNDIAPWGAKGKSAETNGDSLELRLQIGGASSHDRAILVRNRSDLATIALEVRLFRVKCF